MDRLRCCYLILLLTSYFTSNGEATVEGFSRTHDSSAKPKLLLISVAGFRKDYITKINCTNLQHFVADGTSVKYVENSMNVASIANHYSIVTGLYSESHGIVSKTMFDPKLNRVFNSKTRAEPEWWANVRPIWQEVEKQGRGLSALCHWPGVYGPMVSNLRCGRRESLKADVDQALKWLKNDVKLVLLYSDDIKKAALKWGPFSQQAVSEVEKFDSVLEYLMAKSRELNVNIVLTSDSGVTDLMWDHVIDLDQCINPSSYALLHAQATLLIYPKKGYTSMEIQKNLTKCSHIKVHLKENLPAHFHFSHNRRIPPVIAFVPLGSVVRSSKPIHRNINEILNGSSGVQKDMGGSGYHPGYELMRGVFYANGPSFQSARKYGAINNTDIYEIMCTILDITPQPNNASFDIAKAMLRSSQDRENGENLEINAKTSSTKTPSTKTPSTKTSSTKTPSTKTPTIATSSSTTKIKTTVKTYSRYHALLGDLELRGFLIFLACVAGLMLLFCCICCLYSMKKNIQGEFKRKASVFPPLLSANLTSSDEE